jgi:hypothetical protein
LGKLTYRTQLGAAHPTDVFIPILLATYMSTLCGLLAVAWIQKLNLWDKTILAYLGGFSVLVAGIIYYFAQLNQEDMLLQSALISNLILFTLIIIFIATAAYKKVDAYQAFIDGANAYCTEVNRQNIKCRFSTPLYNG